MIDLKTGKPIRLSPKAEARNLHAHGTRPWTLTAVNLLQAAEADVLASSVNAETLAAERHNIELEARGELAGWRPEAGRKIRKTVFVGVGGLMSPADVLRHALATRREVIGEDRHGRLHTLLETELPRNRWLLYESEELLREALELAERAG